MEPEVLAVEVFNGAFVRKYYGTAHQTGVKFFDNAARVEVTEGQCVLHMRPGDSLVTTIVGRRFVVSPANTPTNLRTAF